jgi:lipopolysaccharide transport system permease protein
MSGELSMSARIGALGNAMSVGWLIARRDLTAGWRASRLSIVWPLIYPLAYTGLFVGLRPILQPGAAPLTLEYMLHVFVGFSLWQLWFEAMRLQMDAVKSNRLLLSRADLSPASLLAAGFLVQVFHLALRMVVAIASAMFLPSPPGLLAILAFVVLCTVVVLNGCTLGFLMQPFATLAPDLARILQSVSLALLVSGGVFIVLPPNLDPWVYDVLSINPLAPLIEAARAPLLGHPLLFGYAAWIWIAITLVALTVQSALARKVLPVLLERIGG